MKQGHPMRRADRLVSEEIAREIMEKAEYGIIMTADLEGQPYGVAVSHVVDGDKIYFHCAANVGRKIENIKVNNKVCMNFTCNTFKTTATTIANANTGRQSSIISNITALSIATILPTPAISIA